MYAPPVVPDATAKPSSIYIAPSTSSHVPVVNKTTESVKSAPVYKSVASSAYKSTERHEPSSDESNTGLWDQLKSLPGRLVIAIVGAGVGTAFQHGYNTGVTNVPTDVLMKWINSSSLERNPDDKISNDAVTTIFSAIVAVFAMGGMLGALATGFVADRIGRKRGLILNNLLVIIAAAFMGFAKSAKSWEMLMVGRFVIGVNSGLNAGLGPMYLSEISPVHFRGAIGTIYQLIITISILASNVLGASNFLGTEEFWPVLLASTLFGSLVMLSLLPLCPESPNFLLIIKENDVQAEKALRWLRGTSNVHEEMEEMKHQADELKKVDKVTLSQMWTNQILRKPLIISLVVMMGQQLSGINAVMFYSRSIFQGAGLDANGAYIATLVMGVINISMTFVSLILIDRLGRKLLLSVGFGGMAITTLIFVICLNVNTITFFKYLGVVAVFLFVVMFAIGPGSIPWFLVSELFAVDARGMASSLAVAINWGANFIVGLSFLPINLLLGNQTFLIFTVILSFMVFYTRRCVPETKGRTVEEIQAEFRQNN